MPEPTPVPRSEQLAAKIGDELRERFTMQPMGQLTEASLRAEAERLGREALGEAFGGIDTERQYRCPARDCEFETLDPEATCPLHGRKVYWCGYALRVNVVPEAIDITVIGGGE